jgi:hypothetical protein
MCDIMEVDITKFRVYGVSTKMILRGLGPNLEKMVLGHDYGHAWGGVQ